MNIDITNTPPSTTDIARAREDASHLLRQRDRRETWFKAVCYAIGALGSGAVLVLWLTGIITGDQAYAFAFAGAGVFAAAGAV